MHRNHANSIEDNDNILIDNIEENTGTNNGEIMGIMPTFEAIIASSLLRDEER